MSSPAEDLARELWRAYVARHAHIPGIQLMDWVGLSEFDQQTWVMLARLSMSFWTDPRPGPHH